ncbi:mitochondrial fission factor homolog B isoform X3 [Callorhinchus milii]|uniref:Mitochondrial fission factor n=1 Tax=Callorhinchus milii TaxID=7868 RepID=V9KK92_CALMI|nr:mitochondrial fission factor homolog B isoform X3 [Callorhinchus milii]
MNTAAFPSPTAELAEINRIHYEMNYTEDISHRMRVPEKLQVAAGQSVKDVLADFQNTTVAMQVPERIFIAGDGDNSRPKDLDLVASQSSALGEPLALKTPPRILTLNDRPLDFLDLERSVPQTPQNEEVRSQGRIRRERSMSENTLRQNGQLGRMELMYTPSNCDFAMEGTADDLAVVDAASLRRQIIKLNRRLQLLEEENRERTRREIIMYSITVGFWLINSWLWFRR